jgi:hypothetical protein
MTRSSAAGLLGGAVAFLPVLALCAQCGHNPVETSEDDSGMRGGRDAADAGRLLVADANGAGESDASQDVDSGQWSDAGAKGQKDAAAVDAGGNPALPSPFSLVVPDGFGVDTHIADSAPAVMDAIVKAGVRWDRQDFPWPVIEQQQGVYDWAGIGFDAVIAAWDQRGIRGLNVLGGANSLYGAGNPVTASQRQAFTNFVASAVTRYQGRGHLWEVWNEPEHDWAPADYAQLVKDVAAKVKSVAPGEQVVGPALGFASGTSSDDLVWLEEIFKAGVLDDFSAVTLHPYLDQPESVFQEYQAVTALITKYAPGRSIPILSGEWGFQTSTTGGVSDAVQAQMVTRIYLTNLFNGVPMSIWYDWNDDGTDPANAENNYGMVGPRPAMTPKKAYYAACNVADLLSGYSLQRRVSAGSQDTDLVLRFVRAGQPGAVFVGWVMQPGITHTVTLPASEFAGLPTSIQVRGNLGETLSTLTAGASGLSVTIDNSPTYFLAR